MKINISDLVIRYHSPDDIIGYLSDELTVITKNLVKDAENNSWCGIGASINQLGELTSILGKLNEKVNGIKENVVL